MHAGTSRNGPSQMRNMPLHSSFGSWYPAPPPPTFPLHGADWRLFVLPVFRGTSACELRLFGEFTLSARLENLGAKSNFSTEIHTLNRDTCGKMMPVRRGEWNWSYGRYTVSVPWKKKNYFHLFRPEFVKKGIAKKSVERSINTCKWYKHVVFGGNECRGLSNSPCPVPRIQNSHICLFFAYK